MYEVTFRRRDDINHEVGQRFLILNQPSKTFSDTLSIMKNKNMDTMLLDGLQGLRTACTDSVHCFTVLILSNGVFCLFRDRREPILLAIPQSPLPLVF